MNSLMSRLSIPILYISVVTRMIYLLFSLPFILKVTIINNYPILTLSNDKVLSINQTL